MVIRGTQTYKVVSLSHSNTSQITITLQAVDKSDKIELVASSEDQPRIGDRYEIHLIPTTLIQKAD